ncbi:MAG: undecaprenyl-phosphate glucose phosphotransferase, partial [Woeseia sp.]
HLLDKWVDSGRFARDVVILGAGERGKALLKAIGKEERPRVRVVGFFDDRTERHGEAVEGIPLLGQVSDLVEYLRVHPSTEIMITLPWSATERLQMITRELKMLPVDVHLVPELAIADYGAVSFSSLGSVPILRVGRRPLSGWKLAFKWLEDRILGSLLMLLAAPLLIVIALAVKLTSPGPIFFRQDRYGFNHKLIGVYKFRTMYAHMTDANAEKLTTRDDARITPVGKFLRRTSLDELPQLLNVLRGEMSLVGPRPHATAAKAGDDLYQDVADDYAARHKVKPGITGWAQVNGWRGETDTHEKLTKRVEYDIYYIENYSLWMDIRILFKTLYVCVKGSNAF